MSKKLDLVGRKFGNLWVLKSLGTRDWKTYFSVICDCGKKCVVSGNDLNCGHRSTCGCRMYMKSHGMTGTRFYMIYQGIKDRTLHRPDKYFRYKKVKICDRWMEFAHFFADMHLSYERHVKKFGEKNTSIDRKNNELGYSPENCRWATVDEQLLNRKNTIYLSDGKNKMTMKDWSKKLGLPYNTLFARYMRDWPEKEVIHGRLCQPRPKS